MKSLGLAVLAVAVSTVGCDCAGIAVDDGGTTTDGGNAGGGTAAGGGSATGGLDAGASVLEHHNGPARLGVYVDPALTKAAVATLHKDPAFVAALDGPTYAQPLFLDHQLGARDVLLVATEQNVVQTLDADGGATVWKTTLAPPVALSHLPCGNIDPLGITGTPSVDLASRTVYLDAMTTPDDGATQKHLVYALSLDTGTVVPGWPVDLELALSGQNPAFVSRYQNQRGALALLEGVLYVPFGGHFGDCGTYHGWVIGISVAHPASVTAWHTEAKGGGIWNVAGVTSDGAALYVATGNTFGATSWGGGDGVYRLGQGPVWSGAAADSWAPANWKALDSGDLDLGTALPFDVPGAPALPLVAAFGKDGKAYLLDRSNLGGIGKQLDTLTLSSSELNGAATSYSTDAGTFVVAHIDFGKGSQCTNGATGNLAAVAIHAGPKLAASWCAAAGDLDVPSTSMSAPGKDAIVWAAGASQLHAYDAETGASLFTGKTTDAITANSYFNTPIIAKGRVWVATHTQLYSFKP
jgi:outer membrane protein assembly factor BamB